MIPQYVVKRDYNASDSKDCIAQSCLEVILNYILIGKGHHDLDNEVAKVCDEE